MRTPVPPLIAPRKNAPPSPAITTPHTIIDFLTTPTLFGAMDDFKDLSTWTNWLVYLKALYGLPMSSEEECIFCRYTLLPEYRPPNGGWQQSCVICGRQSGKTQVASVIQLFASVTAPKTTETRRRTSVLVSQDKSATQDVALKYARQVCEDVPYFAALVKKPLEDRIVLKSGLEIIAYPCTASSIRGPRPVCAVIDELAHFRSSGGAELDDAVLKAIRPSTEAAGAKLIILSSPSAASGALYEMYRRFYGVPDSPILVWSAPAFEMNPKWDKAALARLELIDPEAYKSEILGQFRAGTSTFLQPTWVDAVTVKGRLYLPPRHTEGIRHLATVDMSSLKDDACALSICHLDSASGKVVQDLVVQWAPPKGTDTLNVHQVVAEICAILARFGLRRVTGDRYALGFVHQSFRDAGITYELPTIKEKKLGPDKWSQKTDDIYLDKSRAYLECLSLFSQGMVELLDNPIQNHQFKSLERKARHGSDDDVDHRPGQHDDLANATALGLALLGQRAVKPKAGPAGLAGITQLGEPGNGAVYGAIRPAAGTPGGQLGHLQRGAVGGQASQLSRPYGAWG